MSKLIISFFILCSTQSLVVAKNLVLNDSTEKMQNDAEVAQERLRLQEAERIKKENIDNIASAINKCRQQQSEAEMNCDIKQNSQVAEALIGINQLTQTLQNAGINLETNCRNLGTAVNIAQNAMSAMKTSCSEARELCLSVCEESIDTIRRISRTSGTISGFDHGSSAMTEGELNQSKRTCQSYLSATIAAANVAALSYGMKIQTDKCQANVRMAEQQREAMCRMNPAMPGCGGTDCTRKESQNNPVCKCRANPGDPSCVAYAGSMAGKVGVGATGGSRDISSTDNLGGVEFGGGGNPMEPDLNALGGGSNGVNTPGGASGRGIGSANLSGGPSGGAPGADQGSGFKTDILKTARGGAGGGAFGGGNGSGDGSGNGDGRGGLPGGEQMNLSQFLPGSKIDMQRRGLAGASGPDGITGPNTDIWQKISNRYNSMRPLMMP